MTAHAKKNIGYGSYNYRGFILENNGECWVIGRGNPVSYETLDAEDTKKDAMLKVDNWLAI